MAVGAIVRAAPEQNTEISRVQGAAFYVPCLELALLRKSTGLSIGSNTVYVEAMVSETAGDYVARLQKLARLGLGTLLAECRGISELSVLLKCVDQLVVVIVSGVEDMAYWSRVRDAVLSRKFPLVLRLSSLLSPEFVARYKTLPYVALLVELVENVQELVLKRLRPDVMVHEDHTLKLLMESLKRAVAAAKISPCSDMLIDPLQPLTTQLGLEVYHTFEQDNVKYAQYDAAIEMAIDDLRYKYSSLLILIVGPGRGPLLRSVMSHTLPTDQIVAIERNEKCISTLREIIADKENVLLIHGDVRTLEPVSKYNLVVSELLGSFGCNEACPEILRRFTSSSLIMIPQEYTSYVQPIYTDLVDGSVARPYLASPNSFFPVGPMVDVFSFSHPGHNELNQQKKFSVEIGENDVSNALLGYFEATLYGPYRISIIPKAHAHEWCLSWYPMVFPIGETRGSTEITITRVSEETRMWYEWNVGKKHFNCQGSHYVINL